MNTNWLETRGELWYSVEYSVCDSVGNYVWIPVRYSVEYSVRSSVWAFVISSVRRETDED